jgi:hypothetical protein
MAIQFPVQFGPFYSYTTEHLKTGPFENWNQKVSDSLVWVSGSGILMSTAPHK